MKVKHWILVGLVFAGSCGVWVRYVLSRRAYLQDFNTGVHAYLGGNFIEAEAYLRRALDRRPQNDQTKQLLVKVLIEQSFAQYHHKDFSGALSTLTRASQITPVDKETSQALQALRGQLAIAPEKQPVNMEQVLAGLYHRLPEKSQPESLQSLLERYLERSQNNQEVVLKRFWDNQETWLTQLQHEKEGFKNLLYGGLIIFGILGGGLLAFLIYVLNAYFGRRGVFARLLEDHYQRLVTALPAGSHVMLGPPMSLHNAPEAHRMDVIEAEIVSGHDNDEALRRLQPMLEEENPWVRARAAKILYRVNPSLALTELKRLVSDASSAAQVPGIWALSEIASADAVDLLAPLAYSSIREIQQGTIRSLLQLHIKPELSAEVRAKIEKLLPEIRSKTGWVF